MQGSAWVDLIQRLPSHLYDSLGFGLVTGGEVVVQQIIRLEQDFVIVRGRMSGSTAEGRIMVVPYSHITLIAINRRMMEPEVQEVFGAAGIAAAGATPAASAAPAAERPAPQPTSDTPPTPQPAGNGQRPGDAPKPPPSKSVLLAHLRERLAERAK